MQQEHLTDSPTVQRDARSAASSSDLRAKLVQEEPWPHNRLRRRMPSRRCVSRSYRPSLRAAQINDPRTNAAVKTTETTVMTAAAVPTSRLLPSGSLVTRPARRQMHGRTQALRFYGSAM